MTYHIVFVVMADEDACLNACKMFDGQFIVGSKLLVLPSRENAIECILHSAPPGFSLEGRGWSEKVGRVLEA